MLIPFFHSHKTIPFCIILCSCVRLQRNCRRESFINYAQLYFLNKFRQPLTFPGRLQPSIISRLRLNRRVRHGYGCFPQAHRHRKFYKHFKVRFHIRFTHMKPFRFAQLRALVRLHRNRRGDLHGLCSTSFLKHLQN